MAQSQTAEHLNFKNYLRNVQKEQNQQKMEKEAEEKMKRNYIFFGKNLQRGYQNLFGEAINPLFKDKNSGSPDITKLLSLSPSSSGSGGDSGDIKEDVLKLAENLRNIDIYAGLVDGHNYGKFDRLYYQKRRHMRCPYGTEQKFCVPITDNMNYGWWMKDSSELEKNKWFIPRERFPIKQTRCDQDE